MEMQVNAVVTDEDGELYPAIILEWLAAWYSGSGTRFRSDVVVLEFGTMTTFEVGISRVPVGEHMYTSRDPKYRTWSWHSPEERSLPIWVPKDELDAYSSAFDM